MTDIRRTILWVIFGFLHGDAVGPMAGLQRQAATFFPSAKPPSTAKAPGRAAPACRRRSGHRRCRHGRAGHAGAVPRRGPPRRAARGAIT
jgi:YidC/Oxa1 family membrane protein insertase